MGEPPKERKADGAKRVHGPLFDYSFSSFVTPRIIKVLYVLATILISLWTLVLVLAAFNVSERLRALDAPDRGPALLPDLDALRTRRPRVGRSSSSGSTGTSRRFVTIAAAARRSRRRARVASEDAPVVAPAEPPPETDGDGRHRDPVEPSSDVTAPDAASSPRARRRAGFDALLRELRRGAPARRTLLHELRAGLTVATCGNCGSEEPEGSRFCGSCGAPFVPADQPAAGTAVHGTVTLICPNCGNEEPEGARYCGSCSAPLSPVDRPAAPAVALTSETPRVEPGVESPSPVEAHPTPPAAGRRRTRWIAVGAVAVLLVAGGAFAAVLLRDDGENDEALNTEQQPPPTVTFESSPPASSPTLADTRRSPSRAALRVAGCADRSGPLARAGRGLPGRAAARGRGARLRPGRDTTGPRRSGSGRQHGGRCARAVASRACGPSRVCAGGCSLPHSAPVPHQRTGAGGDHAGGAGAARLREPHGRLPGPPGRLHERLRQPRAACGRAGTEASAVTPGAPHDRPRVAARRRQARRSSR